MSGFRRALLPLAILAAAAVAMPAGADDHWAHQESSGYITTGVLVCTPCYADVHLGGTTFQSTGLTPAALVIEDASGMAVPFEVCQDLDGNVFCGEPGEPVLAGCGTSADLRSSEVPFDPASPVTVLIGAATVDSIAAGCTGSGTTGSVTLFSV